MLIDCPGCARSYHVSHGDIGDRGRTVVCPRCNARWYQGKGGRDIELAAVSARAASHLDEAAIGPRRFHLPRAAGVFAGLALTCLALASLVIGREHVVRAIPRAAAVYAAAGMPVNVVGLTFEGVKPERLASSDVTVRGALRNIAGRRVRVPRLAFEVRDATGATLVAWSESVPERTLAVDGVLRFASMPHRLPAESRTVLVRFD